MRYVLYSFFFFCCLQLSYSQETVLLKGKVLNDSIEVASITVVNVSLRVGTITNVQGQFEIEVRQGDTLNISAVQYESRELVVNEPIFNRAKISFYLIPKINKLDEVKISNIDLTGDLSKDIGSTKFEIYIDPRDLGIPANRRPTMTPEERRLYSGTAGAGSVGALINAISGRTKMLKRHLEISKLRGIIEQKRDRYTDSLYMKSLNIPPQFIEDFVYYIFEDKQAIGMVDTGDDLKLLDYMITKSPEYLKLKADDGSSPEKKAND